MKVDIIAEIAQGYEGSPQLAKMLAKAATRSGADGAKFQIIFADELATPDYPYYKLFSDLEMPFEAWHAASEIIKKGGMALYFDVFGKRSLDLAESLGADGVKIHSTDFFNRTLITTAIQRFSRILISFGGIQIEELGKLIKSLDGPSLSKCVFMYGYQSEPTPLELNNLARLKKLTEMFPGASFGFMDHADGVGRESHTLSLLTLTLGVRVIEKHLSLDRELELEDYISALDPGEFKVFSDTIRLLSRAVGSQSLELTDGEVAYGKKAVKVVVAARPIDVGTVIGAEMLTLKRVTEREAEALVKCEDVLGKIALNKIGENQQLTSRHLQ